ncbi:hypothetical protein HanRHA438_Chr09g0387451 [Helianthus annuus]|nr:hypothetical protein HanRHA438_Chr09g0387451 [Helianthus annuus]
MWRVKTLNSRVVSADEDEDDDVDVPGGGLPVLKWSKGGFKLLMATVQMAKDWDATYPQVGDTGADAPAGYITLWADFFNDGNLRLPVTVFVAEVLEYYHLHISNLVLSECSELGTLNTHSCPWLAHYSGKFPAVLPVDGEHRFFLVYSTAWESEVDDAP